MSGKLVKSSVALFILTLASKVIIIFRDMAMAAVFGASTKSDAYVVAISILTLVGVASLAALVVAYIPIVSGKDEDTLNYITNNYMTMLSILTIFLSIVAFCFARQIIRFFAPGFSEEAILHTKTILQIALPFLFSNVVLHVSIAYLQHKDAFWYQGFSAIIANSIIIVSVLVSHQKLMVLSVGYLASIMIPAVFGLWLAYRRGLRPRAVFSVHNQYLRELILLAIPIFFSQVFLQLNVIVDKNFSSKIGTGIVTSVDYAHKIADVVVGTAVPAIGTVIFPQLARLAEKHDAEFSRTLGDGICATIFISFPLLAGTMVLSEPISNALLLRGNYSTEAAGVTAATLLCYAAGILPLGLAHTLNNGFFALKDTKTPIACGAVSTILNIILDFALVGKFSYRGLAIATSVSNYVNVVLYFVCMRKKIGDDWLVGMKECFRKTGIATAVMTAVLLLSMSRLKPLFGAGAKLNLLGCVLMAALGVLLYGSVCLGLKEKTTLDVITAIKGKGRKKSGI